MRLFRVTISVFAFIACSLAVCAVIFVSCVIEKQVQFSVSGTDAVLFSGGRAAREGVLDFSKTKKVEYRFDETFTAPPNSSFQIEYDFSFPPAEETNEDISLVLNTEAHSWELPMDFDGVCNYAVPIENSFNGKFNIELKANKKIERKHLPVFKIHSVDFSERFYGFSNINSKIVLTPFVFKHNSSYVIDIPSQFWREPSFAGIDAVFSDGGSRAVLEIADRKIETFPGVKNISISPFPYLVQGKAVLTGDEIISFVLTYNPPFPVFPKPIKADPALVIDWERENWRNTSYEIFKWDRFPSLLIFDYADYAVQDRMLKRLAFYVEKAGFRGRLAPDSEIADLHGWNAHDYRAADLAGFFDTARKTNFPLSDEERELENILLNEGIIREEQGSVLSGEGGIISITRESPDYLRYRFMVHEGFHGLFFIDEDFRNFSRSRWELLPPPAKKFITSYFEFQQYDVKDEYLLVNEFMAYILQQSVRQSAEYFGKILPSRLENTWRVSSLPQKDEASETWTELAETFTEEAQAFSGYVNRRWSLASGRVWGLMIR